MSDRDTATAPTAPPDRPGPPPRDPRHGLEVFLVLGVSLGASGLYALLSLVRDELTVRGGVGGTSVAVQASQASQSWLDLAYQLAGVVTGVMPALLAMLLLWRDPGRPQLGIGWTRVGLGRAVAQGAGFAALIGVPGLGLVYGARQLGLSARIVASTLPDDWWRIPVSVLAAFQNGFDEEIVVVAFLLTRFAQMGWGARRAVLVAAVVRGSYHLYQGFGGFAGNLVMGLLFGWWFTRTRRVVPLVVAHTLLDAASFIGYVYLAGHVSWL